MHQHYVDDPDMENVIIVCTVIRAHPYAVGASKKNGERTLFGHTNARHGWGCRHPEDQEDKFRDSNFGADQFCGR